MMEQLDHIVLVCANPDEVCADYSLLLGRQPDWVAVDHQAGTKTILFRLNNTSLEILGSFGVGAVGEKLRNMEDAGQHGLASLAFSTSEIADAHKQASRRGLQPSDIIEGHSQNEDDNRVRRWNRFRLGTDETYGVRHFILENAPDNQLVASLSGPDCVSALDHVVINSSNADRALALYGARLGGELKLIRRREDLDTQFMFLRIGGATIEIVSRLNSLFDKEGDDKLWGVSWQVLDIEGAHKRLSKAGFDLSSISEGRKKGSQVFTVRNRTCNTPTLFIQQPKK